MVRIIQRRQWMISNGWSDLGVILANLKWNLARVWETKKKNGEIEVKVPGQKIKRFEKVIA